MYLSFYVSEKSYPKLSNLESYSTNSIVYIISVIYVAKIKHFTKSV